MTSGTLGAGSQAGIRTGRQLPRTVETVPPAAPRSSAFSALTRPVSVMVDAHPDRTGDRLPDAATAEDCLIPAAASVVPRLDRIGHDVQRSVQRRRASERHLTGDQGAAMEPLLPKGGVRPRLPKWTRRQLTDGTRLRVRTGIPWRTYPRSTDRGAGRTVAESGSEVPYHAGAVTRGNKCAAPGGCRDAEPRRGRRACGAVLGVFAASCLAFAGWLVPAGNPPGGPDSHSLPSCRVPHSCSALTRRIPAGHGRLFPHPSSVKGPRAKTHQYGRPGAVHRQPQGRSG